MNWRAGVLALVLMGACLGLRAETLVLGVLTVRDIATTQAAFEPLARYLEERVPGITVQARVFNQTGLQAALQGNELDLIFTNPVHFEYLRSQNSLSGVLATVLRGSPAQPASSYGGVIFALAGRADLSTLADLKGRRVAHPEPLNLGGYQAPAYELGQQGLVPGRDLDSTVMPTQEAVVHAVLSGEADAGFVRSGLLEAMAAEGRIDLAGIRIINRQQLASFPFLVSTRLYPEWPVVALPHIGEARLRQIASALLALPGNHPAALSAGIAGFGPAADYLPVERLARALKLPPYDVVPRLTARELWHQYSPWIITLAVAGVLLMSSLLALAVAMRRVRRAARRLQTLVETWPEPMVLLEHGRLLLVNRAAVQLLGHTSRDSMIGRLLADLSPRLQPDGSVSAVALDHILGQTQRGKVQRFEWTLLRADAQERIAETSLVPVVQENRQIVLCAWHDISDRRANEERLREQQRMLEQIAHYDALTQLPNRLLLADRLHQAMARSRRTGYRITVAYIDLDGFKEVNDRHGHDAGDELLTALAGRMQAALRETDFVSRLGGDEFVAVLGELNDHEDCELLLDRLLQAVAQPIDVSVGAVQVSASVGYTLYPQGQEVDADQLLRQADQAMYQAKVAGKNRHQRFDIEQERVARDLNEGVARIRQALVAGEFELFYQPKVNLGDGALVGVEALLRWRHPERGLLTPDSFLPAIQSLAVSIDLGEWVIAEALAQMRRWGELGLRVPVSVNVGARQLQQPGFVERLQELLAAHPQLEPGMLEIEILESTVLSDTDQVQTVMERCRDLGVAFSLDDFGTGYSSLSHLRRLPVTVLKIDRSFVIDMFSDPEALAIVEGVIGLARALRRGVLAEGVESFQHIGLLRQLGCRHGQGYGIARPMPAHELSDWLQRWRQQFESPRPEVGG